MAMAWFNRWRKRSIDRISMDELRREKIRLEQEEAKLIKRIDELENQKKLLFQEGVNEDSQRKQVMLARRIKELEAQAKNYDNNLRMLSKQIRAANGFIQIKENQKYFEKIGVGSVIAKMDIEELQSYMERTMVENQLQVDKFGEVLGSLEDTARSLSEEEDKDTLELVDLMQQARQVQEENPEEAMEKVYRKVDQKLKGESEQETI